MCRTDHGRAQCHLLYLVYRCYRELRLGDDMQPRWTSATHAKHAALCRRLKERGVADLYAQAQSRPQREALNPFVARTGFTLEELATFFGDCSWRPGYGGQRWTKIAQHALDLLGGSDKVRVAWMTWWSNHIC